jgi:hypothetical protein
MILRLSRTRVHRSGESQIRAALRIWLSTHSSCPEGLLDLMFGRRVTGDGRVEHITVMLWRDQDALVAGLGPDWDRPSCMIPSAGSVLEDHRIEHFEVLADDWPKLIDVLETRRPPEHPLSH